MKSLDFAYDFRKSDLRSIIIIIIGSTLALVSTESLSVFAIELYSAEDPPFGIPLDVWQANWWKWWVGTNNDEANPKPGGCIMNNSSQMVMLMESAQASETHQLCNISSTQGIIIPLWGAFWEASTPEYSNYSYEQLSKQAHEGADLGAITSLVKVDDVPIAKLNVKSDMNSGSLNYKINSMDNVTELYSKGFNLTIPEDTHYPEQNTGTWRSGAHGWMVFLKPLPMGNHTVYYNVGVTDSPNDHSAEITYTLQVN